MLVSLVLAAVLHAQPRCGAIAVSTIPARPTPGTLFVVRVVGVATAERLEGSVAGEPLHFGAVIKGSRVSFAAAPIDSTSVGVIVACRQGDALDSIDARVTFAKAAYRLEKLRVAPQFSATPDSALAARQAREAALAAAVSRASHDTPRLWTGAFAAPRPGRITSTYGNGRQFNDSVTSRHMGTDWAGTVGAPIRAMQRGVVRLVDRFYLGGNVVYVDHGEGLVTAYLHMSTQRVAVGDTVQRGTVLGLVGATGRVTGPHLHVIARYGAISVDPQSVLRRTAAMR